MLKRCMFTRDIQFHENISFFFSSECSLQGETVQNTFEDNTPNLNLPNLIPDLPSPNHPSLSSPDLPNPNSNPSLLSSNPSLNQIAEDSLNLSSEPKDSQDSKSSQSAPEAKESPDVHSKVNSFSLNPPTTEPRYPSRINRGIPKKQYDPDIRTKAKYPINNFISTHRLSESHAYTVNQLSTISIPRNMQEALIDLD